MAPAVAFDVHFQNGRMVNQSVNRGHCSALVWEHFVPFVKRLIGGNQNVYSNRMEYGPRALGARSILASAVDSSINDILNRRLSRTEFMPFAPVVSEYDATEVFELSGVNMYATRFMTITCTVRSDWRERIPAVVHVDNSARPQIIRRDWNPLYFDILDCYKRNTGIPVLINTSFNIHEEPIINSPAECADALADDRVDYVVTRSAVYSQADKK